MGSIAEKPVTGDYLTPPLAPTEQVGPRGWLRYFYNFELPENYDIEYQAGILRKSFKALKDRVPIIGCEVMPMAGPQANMLQYRHYGDEIDDFKVKDYRAPGAFPSTYAELKAKRFPASAFDHKLLCSRGEWAVVGERVPTSWVQANFIQGGLILNWMIFHGWSDGSSCFKFTKLWAEEIRRAQGLKITSPANIPVEDRAKFAKSSGKSSGRPEDHPEFVCLPFTPTAPPEKLLSDIHHGHVWHFTPSALADLKALAAPAKSSLFPNAVPFISTNDVLTALIFRTVMRAQYPAVADAESAPNALCSVSLDGRRRLGQPVDKYTLGNFLGNAQTTLNLHALTQTASLADVAVLIRLALNRCGPEYWDDLTALIEGLEDVTRFVGTTFLDMPGLSMYETSWREFPLYDLDFGAAFGGHMDAVRVPFVGITHCLEIVLPQLPDGSVEVYMGTQNEAMEHVLKDELWNRFATPVGF